jgi:hypothetical protein
MEKNEKYFVISWYLAATVKPADYEISFQLRSFDWEKDRKLKSFSQFKISSRFLEGELNVLNEINRFLKVNLTSKT